MSAGSTEAHRAHKGRSNKGINHGLPDVVANLAGMFNDGRVAIAPCTSLALRATNVATRTAIEGPKFEILFRS